MADFLRIFLLLPAILVAALCAGCSSGPPATKTAGAVTADFDGSGYELTVTKSYGSTVEIHLDSSFNVMQGPGGFDN